MSFTEFTNNKNKGVLWGTLQEGGVFNNIPSSMFHNVKNIFEMSILAMKPDFDLFFDKNDEGDDDYDNKAAEMIVNSNKSVIKKVIDEVNKIKTQNENNAKQMQLQNQMRAQPPISQNQLPLHLKPSPLIVTPLPVTIKKPKIEEIYRADDIKNTRMSELEIRLKEKQAEMDNMLNNKKPDQIDFSDKALGINKESDLYDKKLAGDEMEKLLAQALASRERELDKLNNDIASESSDSTRIPVNKIVAKRPRDSKNVTFNDADNTKVEYENQDYDKRDNVFENGESNESSDENTLSFFSKLKTKKDNNAENIKSMDKIRIPLDDIMNSRSDGDDDGDEDGDGDGNEIMQLRVQEMHNFHGSRNREWGEMREMREIQKYIVLDQKIQNIQNDMTEIKKNQELILSILEKKVH